MFRLIVEAFVGFLGILTLSIVVVAVLWYFGTAFVSDIVALIPDVAQLVPDILTADTVFVPEDFSWSTLEPPAEPDSIRFFAAGERNPDITAKFVKVLA